ncbi:phage tail tape measure protein [Morganella morganii]|uniref:phage tail tape measure protein n=1 Tax=Morganella morganii TaxID=582 RepID=UPI00076B603F|nr:phage tail tape measure protein [Morganella morganii]AMG69509.1 phage tail tape measure protein [Morganella morganii]EKU4289406.1 phage tail tape measure protein [Morganella morganii]EKU4304941.1 phage tail tape measure protein [Morganella morganii]EKU5661628.1 phage tail tape measure protein [Morganella morganii]EKU5688978.1 phage tail tape measure protein [Morganella morganii]
MSQQIADLVINLSADSTSFTEQVGRVERQLQQAAQNTDASAERMRRYAESQAAAVKRSADAQSDAVKQSAKEQSDAINKSVELFQSAAEALSQSKVFDPTKFAYQWRKTFQDAGHVQTEMIRRINAADAADAAEKKIIEQQKALYSSFMKQSDAVRETSAGYNKLTQIKIKLDEAYKAGNLTQKNHIDILSELNTKYNNIRNAEQRQHQQKVQFIQRLKEQVTTQNLSQKEMLRYQAAQLGVSSSADIYINKLRDSNKETEKFKNNNKQLNNVLNSLSNQFGMSGLLRGGMWGGIISGIVGAGKAAYDAESEFTNFNKQLILTGNYANKTASQLNEMARTLSGGGITRHKMANTLSSVVGTGMFRDNELTRVSKAAAQMNYITGQSVETTINQFKRLQDEPLQMSLELEKANHHLTAAQLEQIRTLELQGDKTAAARLAIDAYAQSINDATTEISDNLGHLESAWVTLKKEATAAWDAMLDIGRKQTLEDQIRKVEGKIKVLGNVAPEYRMKQLNEKLAALKEQKYQESYARGLDNWNKSVEQQKINKLRIQQEYHDKYPTWKTKRDAELAKLEKDRYALTQKQYEDAKAMINYKHRDRKMPGSGRSKAYQVDEGIKAEEQAIKEQVALESKLRVLKEHQSVTDVISAERKKLWETEAQIATLEEAVSQRQLTEQEQALLANKAAVLVQHEKLALLGDEVVEQERLNKLQDQADRYVKQQTEKQNAIRDTIGRPSREAQQALERSQILSAHQDNPRMNEMLAAQAETYAAEEEKRADWLAGAQTAWGDYCDAALDSNAQIQNATSAALNGFSAELTSVLTTGKANFRDFTTSILKMLTEIFVKKSIVMGVDAMGFKFTPNAKGGVYHSPSLSAYSGQVVHTPTMFAFAKGAGVMGEAGPEGIFPLRRGVGGKLGVVAKLAGGGDGVVQHFNITIQNDGSNGQIGPQTIQQIMKLVEQKTKQILVSERRPGGTMG